MIKVLDYGWPYGVRKITVDCDCRVFFDEIFTRGFINKQQITEFIYGVDVVITENDYNKWKVSK
nr:MAG TPA: hypothetical protein [Caudoviricetes sp.]